MDNRHISYYLSEKNDSRTIRENRDDAAGVLLDRSKQMNREKKALLKMVLDQGGTFDQVARLSGEHAARSAADFGRWCGGSVAGQDGPPARYHKT